METIVGNVEVTIDGRPAILHKVEASLCYDSPPLLAIQASVPPITFGDLKVGERFVPRWSSREYIKGCGRANAYNPSDHYMRTFLDSAQVMRVQAPTEVGCDG